MPTKIVIIGGGPAAIEAAQAAATAGAQVTIVSDAPLGGRAGWHSLLPSKVWLTAADTHGLLAEADTLGLSGGSTNDQPANPAAILERIKNVAATWNNQQEAALKALNVEVVTGVGEFVSTTELAVKDSDGQLTTTLQPDLFIIAGGSVPFFPPNLRPDGKQVLAPRFAGHLDPLPKSIVVIGGGATGSEFTYLFNRLGVAVTWIVDEPGVLPAFDPAAGQFLAEVLTKRGVTLAANQLAERIDKDDDGVTVVTTAGQSYSAEMAFVAIGRFADTSRLNLAATGIKMDGKAPVVDAFGRTSEAHIYAVGDVSGAPMVANRAMAQAWTAGRHAAGVENVPPHRPETVIHAIYSEPQVAQVGVVDGPQLTRVRLPFAAALKLHLLPEGEGFVELAYNDKRQVTGGLAVGLHAADVLAPVAVAIQLGASVDDLAALFAAHPTLSELPFMAARLA